MANNFTEDDTFRVLRRAHFNTVRLAVRELNKQSATTSRLIKELAKLGWTAVEYRKKHFETIQSEDYDI